MLDTDSDEYDDVPPPRPIEPLPGVSDADLLMFKTARERAEEVSGRLCPFCFWIQFSNEIFLVLVYDLINIEVQLHDYSTGSFP